MATTKTFSVAGTSTLNGITKIRFANDFVSRLKILYKNGHENVELIELGGEHTKNCLLYTSPSPRDKRQSRMPSSA